MGTYYLKDHNTMQKNETPILNAKVLLLCKRSSYDLYFLMHKDSIKYDKDHKEQEIRKFKNAHNEHYDSLEMIEDALKKKHVGYDKKFRGEKVNYKDYRTIITLGGDGTFLEACKSSNKQLLIGINSAPSSSVGKLCAFKNADKFITALDNMLLNKIKHTIFHRIKLSITKDKITRDILNDILICHSNPAAMSRYLIKIDGVEEEHRSSGIWISTAVGSSGAMHSAGGRIIDSNKNIIQYMPRELYVSKIFKPRFKGGILQKGNKLSITSQMRQGMIFIDGSHDEIKFPFGTSAVITTSPNPIRTLAS
jgi:NAD+ kinase